MWDKNVITTWATTHSREEARWEIYRRLTGEETAPVLDSRYEEAPEQLLEALLEYSQDIPDYIYGALVNACIDAITDVVNLILKHGHDKSVISNDFEVLFRLASAAAAFPPAEIQPEIMGLLALSMYKKELPDGVRGTIARLAIGFKKQESSELQIWSKMRDDSELAFWACRRLVEIDPKSNETLQSLRSLWEHRLRDGWNVGTHPVTHRWLEHQSNEYRIVDLLRPLWDSEELSETLKADLETSVWGRKWKERLRRICAFIDVIHGEVAACKNTSIFGYYLSPEAQKIAPDKCDLDKEWKACSEWVIENYALEREGKKDFVNKMWQQGVEIIIINKPWNDSNRILKINSDTLNPDTSDREKFMKGFNPPVRAHPPDYHETDEYTPISKWHVATLNNNGNHVVEFHTQDETCENSDVLDTHY